MKPRDVPSPRRVVFAHDSNEYGGMELYILRLVARLDRRRYEPALLVPGFRDPYRASPDRLIREAEAQGLPVLRPAGGLRRPGDGVTELARTVRLLRRHRADVVHVHTCRPTGARRVAVAAKLAGVPAVIRTEHLPPDVNAGPRARLAVAPFDALTDYVVALSDGDRAAQIRRLGRSPAKIVRTYTGVDLSKLDPRHDVERAKRRLGLDPHVATIGVVGRLVEQKGVTHLLDAVHALRQDGFDFQVLIAGDGDLRAPLEAKAAALGIDDVVSFLGYRDDVLDVMHAIDIAVMPSLWEGFSLTMLEFMALGKPLVTSDHWSFREALEDGRTGLLAPTGDDRAMAAAVARLLVDPGLRRRLSAAALERVRANYTLERVSEVTMALYDRALAA